MKKLYRILVLLSLLALVTVAWWTGSGMERIELIRPLRAAEPEVEMAPDSTVKADTAAPPAWLRVEVETSWGWFWQKSTGRAYVMVDKKSQQRLKAGTLHVRLEAHNITEKHMDNADSVVVFEKKRGLGIPKRIAVVTAWAENPDLEETSVALEP
ncbi:hypothetical protein KKH27_09315 [bacterium]|nr:hypothetical protein [bacterium]MBU1984500.1 hypothetical protein [bacterium]